MKYKQQQGVVILIAMITLFILAGLSIALLSNSVAQKVITHESQDIILAKQSAEYAVEIAKKSVLDTWTIGNTECNTGPTCTCATGLPCVWTASTFSGVDFTQMSASSWNGFGTTVTGANPSVYSEPQYIIVDLGCDNAANCNRYLVVGRGVGGEASTIAFSQEILSVPTNKNNVTSSNTTFVNAFVDNAPTASFNLSPSTISTAFFVNTTSSVCAAGSSSYAHCEMSCSGNVRVMAWTFDNDCAPTYGPWAGGSDTSAVTLTLNGTLHTISCVP
jgi:Tfp pilus assembly protein PilX